MMTYCNSYSNLPPSVQDPQQLETLSPKYGFFNTQNMLQTFLKSGFMVSGGEAIRTRKKDPRSVKHLLRFRAENAELLNGVYPEVVLTNSHDGTSTLRLLCGLFRLICSNGLIICDGTFAPPIIIRHTHLGILTVQNSIKKIMETTLAVSHRIPKLAEISMTPVMEEAYAEKAAALLPTPIVSKQLLFARREADCVSNLWIIYNRVQENIMRGGVKTTHVNIRRGSTRAVANINRNVTLNSKLWQLTMEFAGNHGSATV